MGVTVGLEPHSFVMRFSCAIASKGRSSFDAAAYRCRFQKKGEDIMNYIVMLAAVVLALAPAAVQADEPGQCADNAGTFMTGVVSSGPVFKRGHFLKNVELSHTHVTLQSDQDGQPYDVAIDNVFAPGYDSAGESIPDPLTSITIGTHLELCGKLYPQGDGIDWVHTDCGDTPTSRSPEGWLKIIDATGAPGPNLEASQEYCGIFHH
jgi:hypothetical protein